METWDAICARRNMQQHKPEPVSDDLNRIAEPEWWELGEASNSGSQFCSHSPILQGS
jgi:hypothetical protein